MFSTRYGFKLVAAAAAVVASVGVLGAQVASNSPRERFTAFAVNMSNVGRSGATPVDIVITLLPSNSESQSQKP